ncbi:hypothetical protein N482_13615 [Pseudoalteromonas luteoviolacea NCIMB 1942]|uniref:Uncharacterized protein n=1 Tax=Pseudoalteromonas luteoviolacea NCIMB 1942 TaxID=1365253 RepID=A0A167AVP2_9GAMM|nr:hypothetical protein N482_13615 [Pseudoalteromonas luteoviolacea NCIMB 1942]
MIFNLNNFALDGQINYRDRTEQGATFDITLPLSIIQG